MYHKVKQMTSVICTHEHCVLLTNNPQHLLSFSRGCMKKKKKTEKKILNLKKHVIWKPSIKKSWENQTLLMVIDKWKNHDTCTYNDSAGSLGLNHNTYWKQHLDKVVTESDIQQSEDLSSHPASEHIIGRHSERTDLNQQHQTALMIFTPPWMRRIRGFWFVRRYKREDMCNWERL